ncbi:MAG: adaptor protein MecA [Eubacteriales bacterium]|jgi:negative regulator of genetic competence, sporulation and motility
MELILINSNKLKIMLTEADMIQYELDFNTINYDNIETRRAFWNILDEAKHRTGFDAASDRIFIQLYPSKEGGCEMYVTKVGTLLGEDKKVRDPITYGPSILLPEGTSEKAELSFMFTGIGLLIAACRLATRSSQITESCAWIDENGTCYLFARTEEGSVDTAFLSGTLHEFGTPVDCEYYITYLKEHGRALCESRAVETLAAF